MKFQGVILRLNTKVKFKGYFKVIVCIYALIIKFLVVDLGYCSNFSSEVRFKFKIEGEFL
jgi:hypothetical protein